MADSFLVLVPHKTLPYHQHLGTTTETGDECGQNGGSQEQNAVHPPMPWSSTKCSGGDAGGRQVQQAYPAPPARHETPCGIASATVPWKWALEVQSKAQFSADWDAETMQSMCRALPFLRELFLGTHADHPKPCRADPSCPFETRGRRAGYARRRNRRDHAKAAVLLDNATSPVAI